jgi:F0F1-type ATP synthase assembly protein I
MADERLQTGPLFVLLGTFIGFGAGFYAMYRALVLDPRQTRRDDEPGSE